MDYFKIFISKRLPARYFHLKLTVFLRNSGYW